MAFTLPGSGLVTVAGTRQSLHVLTFDFPPFPQVCISYPHTGQICWALRLFAVRVAQCWRAVYLIFSSARSLDLVLIISQLRYDPRLPYPNSGSWIPFHYCHRPKEPLDFNNPTSHHTIS